MKIFTCEMEDVLECGNGCYAFGKRDIVAGVILCLELV